MPLLFLIWYVYNQGIDSTDANLQALAALQSKYVLLSSGKLDSNEFEKQKLEIINSMNETIKKELALLASGKLDSNEFEKQKLEIIDLINKSASSSKKDLSELQTTIESSLL